MIIFKMRFNNLPIKSQDSRPTIGIVSPGLVNNHLWLNVKAAARDYQVNLIGLAGGMLKSPHGFEAQANILYQLINPELFDGLIIDADMLCHYVGVPALQAFCDQFSLPMVSNCIALKGIPSILLDFGQGIHDLLAHLIDVHGYRRIAFIRGPETSLTAEERYRAYQTALTAYGIPFSPELVTPGTFFAPSGAEAVRLLFDGRKVAVDALIAANDFMAVDALHALRQRGIRVPEDIAVVGFDDNIEAAEASTLPLTTVNFQMFARSQCLLESVLALLNGEHVVEQVVFSPKLVVRQSCGCPSTLLLEAATAPIICHTGAYAAPLSAHRDALLAELCRALETDESEMPPIAALLDSCIAEIMGNTPGDFLLAFKQKARQVESEEADFGRWQTIISVLRRCVQPYLNSAETLARAEDLWQQARIALSEIIERSLLAQKCQLEQQLLSIQKISQMLLATFDIAEIIEILARELPLIGIQGCCLALYENAAEPTGSAKLILAYNEQGRLTLPVSGFRFSAMQLTPPHFFLPDRQRLLMVEALYFQEQQLGFVVFDVGAEEQFMYKIRSWRENPLCGQISNALQGALLVQRIQEHAGQIVRQQYILDSFMTNVPDAIYFKDLNSRFIQANQALARMFGVHAPDELVGKTDFDFFPDEQARQKYEQEQRIICTGQPVLGLEEPDLQGRWAFTTKMPLRDEHGQIIGTFGISRDITILKQAESELRQSRANLEELVNKRTQELTRSNTLLHDEIVERRRMEEALRASEQQYRLLAENVKDGLLIVQNGQLVFANTIFSLMSGYSPESLLSLRLNRLIPALPDMSQEALSETVSQAELYPRNGQPLWTEIEQTPITWNGQPAQLFTIRDITLRKAQEQHLQEERERLHQENLNLRSTIKERYRFGDIVGKSAAMQRVYERIVNAATSDVNVLIVGESGTGKDLIARTVHQVSPRKAQPFVPVNCASIPETLFEREFFGHQRGAFTGADRDKPGFFDRAHQGVLFLDEVTELTPGMQAKLLRVLQDGEYMPLGSNRPKQADVLIVAATNKDYQEEIARGRLRQDFFYRICVVAIDVPPLRERKDDLPFLIEHLLEQYRRKQTHIHGKPPTDLPTDQSMLPVGLLQAIYSYQWPGNIRELQNVLQRYLATRDVNAVIVSLGGRQARTMFTPEHLSLPEAIETLEKQMIKDALSATRHNIVSTAQQLGIPRSSLYRKLKIYELDTSDEK